MKAPGKIQITVWLLGLAGAALFTILLIRQGAPQVGAAFASAGWAIAAVVAYHFAVPVFLDSLAWWVLFPKSDRLPLRKLLWMRWIGESVSTLVPSAAVGGDIVRARLAAINGAPLPVAAGSVLVDLTLGVFTQAAFTVLGLVLLVTVTGQRNFVRPTLVGTLIGVVGVAGFYFVQRLGMFRFLALIVARLANSPEWQSLVHGGETLDQTIRSAAFAVPGGLGVQEGGYLFVGNLLGIPGDAAFALSLIARVRELALGIPGLISWQVIEARRLLRARLAATVR